MSIRPLFKKGLRWQVGSGKDINFWEDNWVFQYPLSVVVSPVPGREQVRVCDVLDDSGGWNRTLLSQLVPPHIVDKISSLFLPSS